VFSGEIDQANPVQIDQAMIDFDNMLNIQFILNHPAPIYQISSPPSKKPIRPH